MNKMLTRVGFGVGIAAALATGAIATRLKDQQAIDEITEVGRLEDSISKPTVDEFHKLLDCPVIDVNGCSLKRSVLLSDAARAVSQNPNKEMGAGARTLVDWTLSNISRIFSLRR